jgi:hypothetical protein
MTRRALIGIFVWAAVVLATLTLGFCQWRHARTAEAEARLNRNQAGAEIQSGADAVNVIGARAEADAAGDATTRENDDAIRKADGAAAPVTAPARDAGLASLCRRAAYRGDAKCVQRARSR